MRAGRIFQSRSGAKDQEQAIIGSADIASKFGIGGSEDVSRDGSTVLLTEKQAFRNFVLLGAPACGKTTLLQKMRYWAALSAYDDTNEHCPVFVALASYSSFVEDGLKAGKGANALDMLQYLKQTCEPDQYRMLLHYHGKGQLLLLLDGLDECSHLKEPIQQYIATVLEGTVARTVVSSRLAGFSDAYFADHSFMFVQVGTICSSPWYCFV